MAYSMDEQETHFLYDAIEKTWTCETNIAHHINRYRKEMLPDTIIEEIEDGRVISIRGKIDLDKVMVGTRKRVKREYSQEERDAMRERLRANTKKVKE